MNFTEHKFICFIVVANYTDRLFLLVGNNRCPMRLFLCDGVLLPERRVEGKTAERVGDGRGQSIRK